MSARPGVATDARRCRVAGVAVSTLTTPTPGIDFKTSLATHAIQNCVSRSSNYKPLRFLTACVARDGKSFVIRDLTDLAQNLLGCAGDAKVCAPTGVADFQAGRPEGRRTAHTWRKEFTPLGPPKGDALCASHDDIRRALLLGGVRGLIFLPMMGRLEYRASIDPSTSPPQEGVCLLGGAQVVNLLGRNIRRPRFVDAACYDTSGRGPGAVFGLLAHVVLEEVVRKGEWGDLLRGVLTRLRTYNVTEDDADRTTSTQVNKLPNSHWK